MPGRTGKQFRAVREIRMTHTYQDLAHFMDTVPRFGVSGIDCVLYRNHREVFRHQSGFSNLEDKLPMVPDALYNLYSASKIVTCAAALQLVERGLMLLSDPLHAYLPEYEHMSVKYGTFATSPAKKQIRIIDLFTMSAGLSYELDTPHMRALIKDTGKDFSTRDFVKALAKEPLLFEPGEGWNYSYCHDVLGAVIEIVSGLRFGEYLKKNVFDPLGMADTGFSVPEDKKARLAPQYYYDRETASVSRITSDCLGAAGLRHESGGGGLISTTEDYILFADALACGGVGKSGARILSPAMINLMRKNQLDEKRLVGYRAMGMPPGAGYGLGVSVVTDAALAATMTPESVFAWGGIGGVQALINPGNQTSYFVAQHTFAAPVEKYKPHMWNIYHAISSTQE